MPAVVVKDQICTCIATLLYTLLLMVVMETLLLWHVGSG